jgi:hypothetical protein
MKVLIAVLSCHTLRHYEQTIRDTWAHDTPPEVDLRFFLGKPQSGIRVVDEIFLNVDDSWDGITEKSVAVCKWALEQGYDAVLKVDLDTLVRPVALLSAGLEQFDYVGGENSQNGLSFASGGAGYWLSRRAAEAKLNFPATRGPAEDVHTAQALLAAGIRLHPDDRFRFIPGQSFRPEDLTIHLSSVFGWATKYRPEWMHEAYAATGSWHPPYEPIPGQGPDYVQRRFLRRK